MGQLSVNQSQVAIVVNTNGDPTEFLAVADAIDLHVEVFDTGWPDLVDSLVSMDAVIFYAPASLPPAMSYLLGVTVGRGQGLMLFTGPFLPPSTFHGVPHRMWEPSEGSAALRDTMAAIRENPKAFIRSPHRGFDRRLLPSARSESQSRVLSVRTSSDKEERPQADAAVAEVRRLMLRAGAKDFSDALARGSLPLMLRPDLMFLFSSPPEPLDEICPVEIVVDARTIEKKKRVWGDMLLATGRRSLLVICLNGEPKRAVTELPGIGLLVAVGLADLRHASSMPNSWGAFASLIGMGNKK